MSTIKVNSIEANTGSEIDINSTLGTIPSIIISGVTTVAAGSAAAPSITPTGDSDTGIFFPSADTVAIGEGGAEALRIINNKTVLIGKTAQGLGNDGCEFSATTNRMSMPSGNYLEINKTTGTSQTLIDFQTGAVSRGNISYNGTNVAYNTSSDYRLKENIAPVSDGISRLLLLKPSRFNFVFNPDKVVDGFIAHEVQEVVPEAIYGEKDAVDDDGNPVYQGIDQSKLVPLLTAALQEAVAKIESLETRLTAAGI